MLDPGLFSLVVTGILCMGLLLATLFAARRNRRLSLFQGRPPPTRTHPSAPRSESRRARMLYDRDGLRPS